VSRKLVVRAKFQTLFSSYPLHARTHVYCVSSASSRVRASSGAVGPSAGSISCGLIPDRVDRSIGYALRVWCARCLRKRCAAVLSRKQRLRRLFLSAGRPRSRTSLTVIVVVVVVVRRVRTRNRFLSSVVDDACTGNGRRTRISNDVVAAAPTEVRIGKCPRENRIRTAGFLLLLLLLLLCASPFEHRSSPRHRRNAFYNAGLLRTPAVVNMNRRRHTSPGRANRLVLRWRFRTFSNTRSYTTYTCIDFRR